MSAKSKHSINLEGFTPEEAGELIHHVLIEYLTTTEDDTPKRQDVALLFDYIGDAIRNAG